MKYISTRGQSPASSFSEILLGGLAPDGGLYLPETYPKFTNADLTAMRGMNYPDLAFAILSRLIDDIPPTDLKAIIDKTYRADVYAYARSGQNAADITPTLKLEDNLYLLSLSNGPTLAFKDMAMQLLGNLFEYVLTKTGKTTNILGATSGDTGSAAEYAMRGKKGIRVFMLSPHKKMSRFQTAQMFSLQDENIFNIAVNGVFDDCQDMVKAVSNDADFKAKYKIGAVNSINWGRIVAQVVYYFKGYFAVTANNAQQVSFSVPSGNFGNVCAGHIARMMGLPIDKLVVATNENDVLDEFFKTGAYRPRGSANTYHTSSPSMDISKASNFERFVFDLVGRDSAKVRELWGSVDKGGAFDIKQLLPKLADYGFISGSSNHANRMKTIRETKAKYNVVIDTHTADGLKVAMELREADVPMIVLETALPAKFEDAIVEALGEVPERPADLSGIENLPQKFTVMEADVAAIKEFIVKHV
ncbi:threonine synthase [Methylotenera sp.]|uniref:threonine synthase n=1 Tax=Methylotenera sp. TaxID=2051956 RepID=UPI00272F7AD2|nr:threonine synthase [Methylotenera sp.]MDP2070171.1 threonine synthase [Methylotenera sp.]MDP2230982.1 threonine synthase [Methylotenera sp.]MDP3006523.1 threonine synthase [Methylotenera sp.]MDP3141341.1 threonine synthase [Methylotenera sp.]MDP3308327.1 threonine synthase [Methylotenera sp.]